MNNQNLSPRANGTSEWCLNTSRDGRHISNSLKYMMFIFSKCLKKCSAIHTIKFFHRIDIYSSKGLWGGRGMPGDAQWDKYGPVSLDLSKTSYQKSEEKGLLWAWHAWWCPVSSRTSTLLTLHQQSRSHASPLLLTSKQSPTSPWTGQIGFGKNNCLNTKSSRLYLGSIVWTLKVGRDHHEAADVEGGERQQRLWPLPRIQRPWPLCPG